MSRGRNSGHFEVPYTKPQIAWRLLKLGGRWLLDSLWGAHCDSLDAWELANDLRGLAGELSGVRAADDEREEAA